MSFWAVGPTRGPRAACDLKIFFCTPNSDQSSASFPHFASFSSIFVVKWHNKSIDQFRLPIPDFEGRSKIVWFRSQWIREACPLPVWLLFPSNPDSKNVIVNSTAGTAEPQLTKQNIKIWKGHKSKSQPKKKKQTNLYYIFDEVIFNLNFQDLQ